jgi:hypothetical protein
MNGIINAKISSQLDFKKVATLSATNKRIATSIAKVTQMTVEAVSR